VIDEMKRRDGFSHMWKIGTRLQEGVNKACEKAGFSMRLVGPAAISRPMFDPSDIDKVTQLMQGCLSRGHFVHLGLWFLTLAHTMDDIESTIKAVEESLAEI